MSETTNITVHVCEVCGEGPRETDDLMGGRTGWEVEGFIISLCDKCGQYACEGCRHNFCCESKLENEELAARRKELLFDVES